MIKNGYPPTVRELAEMSGRSSTAGVHKTLNLLERKGYIRRGKGKSRSLEILAKGEKKGKKVREYPILGRIAAGLPDLAEELKEGDIALDEEWLGGENSFVLWVKGHSMVDADIRDGDMIIVERTSTCNNGEIVIILLEGEATVKRFFKEKDRIRLQPENPTMHPIYVDSQDPDFRIIGRVKALLRKY
jgi:repressor LexA